MRLGMLGDAQRFGDPDTAPPELKSIMAPDTTLATYRVRVPGFPHGPADLPFQALGHLEAGITAAADCDALFLNTVGDYGLPALKAALSIPVVGAGEASLRLAPSLGRRFAIVTIWPVSMNFIPLGLLRDYGLEALSVGIRNVGVEADLDSLGRDDSVIARMQAGVQDVLDRVVDACHAAVETDGAEVVVLGCTCMSPVADAIAARCPVPVINPLAAALKMAEGLASMRLSASHVNQARFRDSATDRLRTMVDAVAEFPQEECQVCVFTPLSERVS
jgi:allantoin racemase